MSLSLSVGVALRTAFANPYASLDLEFLSGSLDPRITFTRASGRTRFNASGVLETVGNNIPGFDYDPTTLAARGLLIEEQRTNSIRNNTMQGAVAGTPGTLPTNWQISNTAGLSSSVIGFGSESGVNYIDIRVFGTSTGNTFTLSPEAGGVIAASNGQTWTASQFLRLVGGSTANILSFEIGWAEQNSVPSFLAFNVGTISIPTTGSLAANRLIRTGTNGQATTAFVRPVLNFQFNSGVAIDITLRIGLPQLEQGAFATSVIPTTTAAATRLADSAVMTGTNFSSWYNATEGTLFVEGSSLNLGRMMAVIDDGAMNNRYQAAIALSYTPNFAAVSGGTVSADIYTSALTQSVNVKLAGAYKVNDFALSANGSAVTTDTSGALPVGLNTLRIGAYSTGGSVLCGWLRSIRYYPTRLPNAALQALTA